MEQSNKHITIDLGNTIAKIGVFQRGELVDKQVGIPYESLATSVNQLAPKRVIVSSVNQKVNALAKNITAPVIVLSHLTPIPIINKYTTPKTLGKDRLAAVIGAYATRKSTNTLVIDVGTCITYDFINDKNEYLGGAISPGIDLKFKALHNFTAHLPLIGQREVESLIGNSTEKTILSGVINGTIAEIEQMIRKYKNKFSTLRIIICGGGSLGLHNKLKTKIELMPDLVLTGLNKIIEYNV